MAERNQPDLYTRLMLTLQKENLYEDGMGFKAMNELVQVLNESKHFAEHREESNSPLPTSRPSTSQGISKDESTKNDCSYSATQLTHINDRKEYVSENESNDGEINVDVDNSRQQNDSRFCSDETDKRNERMQREQKLRAVCEKRYKLDPLAFNINKSDTPIEKPLISEYKPMISFISENMHNKKHLIKHIEDYLKHLSCIWRKMHHRVEDVQDRYGSTIKMGTGKGSLDQLRFIEEEDNDDCDSYEKLFSRVSKRPPKRKASSNFDSNSTKDKEFENEQNKKPKIQQGQIHSTNAQPSEQRCGQSTPISQETTIDSEDTKSHEEGIEKKKSWNEKSDGDSQNSQRVKQPILDKPKFQGPRDKRRSKNNEDVSLNDSQIAEQLQMDDDEDDDVDTSDFKIGDKIRSSLRLQAEGVSLKNKRMEEENKKIAAKEEEEWKRDCERKNREEIVMGRWRKIEEADKRRQEELRLQKEKAEAYRKKDKSKKVFDRNKLMSMKTHDTSPEIEPETEELLLRDDDLFTMCPICNKTFPHDKIEQHASGCDSDESQNHFEPSGSKSKTDMINCDICDKFSTANGHEFELHVYKCKRNRIENKERSNNAVENYPTSPIKSFKNISQMKDSDIDYMNQFPTKKCRKQKRY